MSSRTTGRSAFAISASTLAVLAACTTKDTTSSGKAYTEISSLEAISAIACAADESYQAFVLTPLADAPEVYGLGFPKTIFDEVPFENDPGPLGNARLDLCLDASDRARLARVIVNLPSAIPKPGILSVDDDAEITGLTEAIFGDPSQLLIKVPFKTMTPESGETLASPRYFLMRGGEVDGKLVTGFGIGETGEPADSLVGFRLVKGELNVGELTFSKCPGGGDGLIKSAVVGSLSLQFRVCPTVGTSGTKNAKLVELTLQDSSEKAPAVLRDQPLLLKGPALAAAVDMEVHHHNVCDNLVVRYESVVYGLTASVQGFGGGNCAPPIDGAPEQDESADPIGVAYRFAYSETDVVEGAMPLSCRHYIWRCE